jgi:hypothetical protein
LALFDLGKVQHLFNQLQQMAPAFQDLPDSVPLFRRQWIFRIGLEQLTKPENAIEGGAELMAHRGQKLGFCRVRALSIGLCLAQSRYIAAN